MSIQVLTAVAQSSNLNAANPLAAEQPDGEAAAGMGFADLLALQMQRPELTIPATSTETDLTSASSDPSASSDTAQQVSDLAAQLLPWLPQTPGLPGQQSAHGNPDAPGQRRLESGVPVEPGRALAQLASLNGQEQRAAATASAPAATDNDPRLQTLPAAISDANARAATPVFTLPADNGKAAEAVAAKTAASNLEVASNALPVQHAQPQGASAPKESAASAPISTPLHDARWATDFGQKVVWIARAEQQHAQINIHPAQLGPIQITINLDGDKASAMFASAHAEVRQAIETALPRLREMMAEAGINLGQANVGSQFAQQQNAQENRQPPSESARLAVDNAILRGQPGVTAGSTTISHRGDGLVDLFA